MKKINSIQQLIAALLMIIAGVSSAANAGSATISLVKRGANAIAVNLENTTPIAGLQFTISASSNIVIESVVRSERTQSASWQIHQNRLNDSTVNVLIINAQIVDLPSGSGAIAEFAFREKNFGAEQSRVNLSRVVVADAQAQSVPISIVNLAWSATVAQAEEKTFQLEQNYPNPFNPSTTIRYKLQQPGQVRLSIFDMTGREVMRVIDQYQLGGSYSVTWNGRDAAGQPLASGVYFAQLSVNGAFTTMRMTLTK
jgi:hypothetical protein